MRTFSLAAERDSRQAKPLPSIPGSILLARLQHGEPQALSELMDRHWAGMVAHALRLLAPDGDEDQAEDLAQQAFLSLWENREDWNADAPAGPLLQGILRNLALNERRHLDVRRRLAHHVREAQERASPTPFGLAVADETRRRVVAAVHDLPPRRRRIFMLVRVRGLSYREVAAELGLSTQTVANQMSAALDALRRSLDAADRGPA